MPIGRSSRASVWGRSALVAALGALLAPLAACGDEAGGVAGPPGGGGGGIDAGGGAGTGGGWPGGAAGAGGSATGGSAALGGSAGASSGGSGATGGSAGTSSGGSAGSGTGGSSGCSPAPVVQCTGSGPCEFPQGVPDADYIAYACSYGETDPTVDAVVNQVMVDLSGCGIATDCPLAGIVSGTTEHEICQSWFAAVTAELRARGFCAGQHIVGSTDEIAVTNTCCEDVWYGYHICNYGGAKVVWNPGARRGWWQIAPQHCP